MATLTQHVPLELADVEKIEHLMHRSLNSKPPIVESAKGIELYLSDGRTIIDACGGAAVAVIGHGNGEVVDAMLQQAKKVSYVHSQAYSTSPAEDLASFVLDGCPHGLEKAMFVCSGSEAMDGALKLARQYFYKKNEPQRMHFVARRQTYHGSCMGSMSVSSNLVRKEPYSGFGYPHVSFVSPAYAYRYQLENETAEQYTGRLLRELEDEFLRVGPSKIIAFVAETIVGATSGCVPPPKGYLRGARDICDKYGILLILDEVMCGVGRCGTYFAFEPEGVSPDIVTLAKGLGGGYTAIAAVLVHRKVVDVMRMGSGTFAHGITYQAHPVSCATAMAVQKIIRRDNLVERAAVMGEILGAKLRDALRPCRSVGDIRGRGLFWAIEFVQDTVTKEPVEPKSRYSFRVQQAAFDRGVAVYPGAFTIDGVRGDHVLLAPPLTVTLEELSSICMVLRDAIDSQERLYLG